MTIEECYERLHGDYKQVIKRLVNKEILEKIMLRFPTDNSMILLHEAIVKDDKETMFRAAHTLKGISATLSFDELYKAASDLTEQLRGCNEPVNLELLDRVDNCYHHVVDTIEKYRSEK